MGDTVAVENSTTPVANSNGNSAPAVANATKDELLDWDLDQSQAEEAAETAKTAVVQKPLTGSLSKIKLFLGQRMGAWQDVCPQLSDLQLKNAEFQAEHPDRFDGKVTYTFDAGRFDVAVWFDQKTGLAVEVSITTKNEDDNFTLKEAKQIAASVGLSKPPVKDVDNPGFLDWNKDSDPLSASFDTTKGDTTLWIKVKLATK